GRQRADIGDLAEERVLDPLDHQLGDAVTTPQHDRLTQVVVDQTDLDLAAIARVDRARRVYHGKTRARGQTGSWMHEPGEALGQRDRDPGTDDGPLTRSDHHVRRGHQ